MKTTEAPIVPILPPRRFLSREEAAAWLGLSVDTFSGLGVPYCDFGPRSHRWDIMDIIQYANDNKNPATAPEPLRMRGEGEHAYLQA